MLALRRASLPLRSRGLSIRASSAADADTERPITQMQDQADSPELAAKRSLFFNGFYRNKYSSANLFRDRRGLASHAGAKSRGEDKDLQDGFSELEMEDDAKAVSGTTAHDESVDELVSEPDFSEDDDVAKTSDAEDDLSEKVAARKMQNSILLKAIIAAQVQFVAAALDKYVEEGNVIDREEISSIVFSLRKFRMYGKALKFLEWLETSKTIEFSEKDYSSRLSLISRVHGLVRADKYIYNIPMSSRGELVYRTLLACCVKTSQVKKAEEVFEKIKSEFKLSEFACNQMILLYKKYNNRKIAEVLLLMEKESLKPTPFTYRMLVDMKGQHGDIQGMEQILETMKSEGVEPDRFAKCVIAKHYFSAGLKEKAESIMKEVEGGRTEDNRHARPTVIKLYGEFGRADEVERVWKMAEANPWPAECMAAIDAWGRLKKVDKAKAVFDKMLKVVKKPTARHYNALLKVYVSNKMLSKGKDLIKHMANKGLQIGPYTWDLLVKLYVDAGELGKADSVLQKAAQHNTLKPLFVTYLTVMEEYAKKGDTHNAEKIFHRMKEAGYDPRIRQFQMLVKAYVNAKAPLYGIRERMKADNVFPTKVFLGQLEPVDAFRKTAVSDLLD